MQALVDRNKHFLNIAICVLRNIHDSYMPFFPVPASLFDPTIFEDGFSSFLIRFVLEHLFNRRLFLWLECRQECFLNLELEFLGVVERNKVICYICS